MIRLPFPTEWAIIEAQIAHAILYQVPFRVHYDLHAAHVTPHDACDVVVEPKHDYVVATFTYTEGVTTLFVHNDHLDVIPTMENGLGEDFLWVRQLGFGRLARVISVLLYQTNFRFPSAVALPHWMVHVRGTAVENGLVRFMMAENGFLSRVHPDSAWARGSARDVPSHELSHAFTPEEEARHFIEMARQVHMESGGDPDDKTMYWPKKATQSVQVTSDA